MTTRRQNQRQKNWQGMNWLRPEKRLAIYLRDGMACAYCGATVEDGAKLTLDHLDCCCAGGTNGADNLVTACHRCNSSRGKRSIGEFAGALATYLGHGAIAADIEAHVADCASRPIDRTAAKSLIARRGGFSAAVLAAGESA